MRLRALLHLRCPHCLQGPIFYGLLAMHTNCPVCGVRYEREDGYFMMAVFIGYILGLAISLPLIITLLLLDAPIWWYIVGATILLSLAAPFIFRYARAIWMHLDELFDPRRDGI